jgi:hypothetical protein
MGCSFSGATDGVDGAGVLGAEGLAKKAKGLGSREVVCNGEPRGPGRGGRGGLTESGREGRGRDAEYPGTANVGYIVEETGEIAGNGESDLSVAARVVGDRSAWNVLEPGGRDERITSESLLFGR